MILSAEILAIAIGILAVFLAGVAYFLFDIRSRFLGLFKSKGLETHEEVLSELLRRVGELEGASLEEREIVSALQRASNVSVQKVSFIRFNPFHNTGGDQSFALALLDGENSGVVISSLYGREGTRVYAKWIEEGVAKQPISEEEKHVLESALKQ